MCEVVGRGVYACPLLSDRNPIRLCVPHPRKRASSIGLRRFGRKGYVGDMVSIGLGIGSVTVHGSANTAVAFAGSFVSEAKDAAGGFDITVNTGFETAVDRLIGIHQAQFADGLHTWA